MSQPVTTSRSLLGAPLLAASAAIVLALVAYTPSLGAPFFTIDDPHYVTENVALRQTPLSDWWRFFTARTNPWEYLPLRDLSYRIDLAAFGLHAPAFRAHNLVLYAFTCAAVWWLIVDLLLLLQRGRRSGDLWVATVAGALFAVHPAHVESVVWIAGRKDVLSGLFAVLSLAAFVRGLVSGRRSRLFVLASYLLFGAAILSKSTVVPVAAVAWLFALAHEGATREPGPAVRRATLLVAPLIALAVVSVFLQVWWSATYAAEPFDGMPARTLAERLLLALRILGELTRIAIAPLGLRLIYDVDIAGAQAWLGTTLGLSAAVLTLLGAWLGVVRRSFAWLGVSMAGILATPFLQLIPFYTWSYASDRFLYLPLLGVGLAAAAGLWRLPRWPRVAVAVAAILLLAAQTTIQARKWNTPKILIAEAAERSPAHYVAAELGIRYVLLSDNRFGDARTAAHRVRAVGHRNYQVTYVDAREAMYRRDGTRLRALVPPLLRATLRGDYGGRVETANMALEAGLLSDAEQAYRGILGDFPGSELMRYNLGLALERQGRHLEAASALRGAIDAGYVTAEVWNHLGLATRNAGDLDGAADAFRQALATDARHWFAGYNLARLQWTRGDSRGARVTLADTRKRAIAAGAALGPLDDLERVMAQRGGEGNLRRP